LSEAVVVEQDACVGEAWEEASCTLLALYT